MDEIDRTKLWYHTNLDVFLNQWFADYDKARAALESGGAFISLSETLFRL
jgi:hypothetical protein